MDKLTEERLSHLASLYSHLGVEAFGLTEEAYQEAKKAIHKLQKKHKRNDCKTQTAWVIMRDDGEFAYQVYVNFDDDITYLDWTDNLCKLTSSAIFETKAEAEACINLTFYTKNCKPVKITISVEEE